MPTALPLVFTGPSANLAGLERFAPSSASTVHFPLLRIKACATQTVLAQCPQLNAFDVVVLPSPGAIEHLVACYSSTHLQQVAAWAVMGQRSRTLLLHHLVPAQQAASTSKPKPAPNVLYPATDAEHADGLLATLAANLSSFQRTEPHAPGFLLACGLEPNGQLSTASRRMVDGLRALGIEVQTLALYQREAADLQDPSTRATWLALLASPHQWFLSSSGAVAVFAQLMQRSGHTPEALIQHVALARHDAVLVAARALGFGQVLKV